MVAKPNAKSSLGNKELDNVEKQFDEYQQQITDLTLDRMNAAPKEETEPQTKLSQKELAKTQEHYLKPIKTITVRQPFNEEFRQQYNFAKEYVPFIAENKEIIGETIDIWTHPFPGMPAEEWLVPTNKPVWGPRYLAEQIKSRTYHRLRTEDRITESHGFAQQYGSVVVDNTIQRLDAHPVSQKRSIFTGDNGFKAA